MFDVKAIHGQDHLGGEFLSLGRACLAQAVLDGLLGGGAHLFEKFAHRHVGIVAHDPKLLWCVR